MYKLLWDDIVTGAFSWPDFLARRRVRDSTAPFSPYFLEQTAELRASVGPGARLGLDDGLHPAHLDELCSIVQSYFQRIGQVEDELALVYLFRDRTVKAKRAKPAQSTEDADIQRAIEASLREVAPVATTGAQTEDEEQLRRALAASLEDAPAPPEPDLAVDEESQVTLAHAPSASAPQPATTTPTVDRSLQRTTSAPTLDAPVASSSSSGGKRKRAASLPPVAEEAATPPSSPSGTEGAIIGTDRFRYDAAALDAHLTDIAQFWRSEREPRGVSIKDTCVVSGLVSV